MTKEQKNILIAASPVAGATNVNCFLNIDCGAVSMLPGLQSHSGMTASPEIWANYILPWLRENNFIASTELLRAPHAASGGFYFIWTTLTVHHWLNL